MSLGVPQGSILRPLMFLFFVNDLPSYVADTTILYADDTNLVSSNLNGEDLTVMMGVSLNKVSEWCQENKLKLNEEKTSKIIYTTRQLDKPGYRSSVKFFGVNLDAGLTWGDHV